MRIHVQSMPGDPDGTFTPEMWREAFGGHDSNAVSFGSTPADLRAAEKEMEVLLAATRAVPHILPLDAPRLKVVAVTSAGVEMLAPFDWLPDGAALLNNSGAHAVKGGEYALMGLLMLANRVPAFVGAQRAAEWRPQPALSVAGARLTIVGLGAIGGQLATFAAGLGMRVTGVRSRAGTHPDCERVIGIDDLPRMLPESDYLVLALPGGETTRNLIDRARLEMLPRGAGLVSLGRGTVLDQDALCDLLEAGALCGAVLDVFRQEPLDPSSRIWRTRNLIVTPHVAGDDPTTYLPSTLRILAENLAAYRSGRPMPNRIDLSTGLRYSHADRDKGGD